MFKDLIFSKVHIMEVFHTFGDLKGIQGLAVPWVYCREHGLGFPLAIMEKVFWNWRSLMVVTSGE